MVDSKESTMIPRQLSHICQNLKLEYLILPDLDLYECVAVVNHDCSLALDDFYHTPI